MQIMLKIGYQKFFLTDDAGIHTVLRCLGRAHAVKDDQRYKNGPILLDGKAEVSIETLSGYRLSRRPCADDVIVPEVLPPAHTRTGLPGHRRQALSQPSFAGFIGEGRGRG